MAKFKVKAGAELEVVTPKELADQIETLRAAWVADVTIGARWTRFSAQGRVTAAGAFEIGGPSRPDDGLGPAPGFVWDIRRVHVYGMAETDVAELYVNDANPSTIVGSTDDVVGCMFTFDRQLVLYPGDALLVAGSDLTADEGTYITISGMAQELPVALAWKLAG